MRDKVWKDLAASLDGTRRLVANQIDRARKVAERLGDRHGVSSQVAQLALDQQGPEAFNDAEVATLLMAEGVYLLALLAEYPNVVPASSPKAARLIARRMTRRLKSPGAERPSIFLAHAVLRYGTSSYGEVGNDLSATAMTAGLELLAAHYPLPAADIEQLRRCEAAFAMLFSGAGAPAFAVTAPNFVGTASAYAIRLLLGTAVEEEDFAATMSGQVGAHALFGPQQLLRLTGIWFDWAARDARVPGFTA